MGKTYHEVILEGALEYGVYENLKPYASKRWGEPT